MITHRRNTLAGRGFLLCMMAGPLFHQYPYQPLIYQHILDSRIAGSWAAIRLFLSFTCYHIIMLLNGLLIGVAMGEKRNRNEDRLACFEFEHIASLKSKVQPVMYRVWLHADPSATLESVVKIVRDGFMYDADKALEIAVESIDHGKALCCILPKDIAETKAEEINELSAKHGNSIACMLQKGHVYVVRKS